MIYAHNAHLNKENRVYSYAPPLGYYIDRQFGDRYALVSIICGSGEYRGINLDGKVFEGKLQPSLSGSVERFCSDPGLDMFCYPADCLPEDIKYIRFVGGGTNPMNFFYFIPRKRTDYILYIDKSSPVKMHKTEEKTNTMNGK